MANPRAIQLFLSNVLDLLTLTSITRVTIIFNISVIFTAVVLISFALPNRVEDRKKIFAHRCFRSFKTELDICYFSKNSLTRNYAFSLFSMHVKQRGHTKQRKF